jgi:CheY-like chemotaxis protein
VDPDGPAAPALQKHRALVIDDEMTIRAALRRYFKRLGWDVEEAANGESAYSLILLDSQQSDLPHYDVILSDLRMPGLNGIELYERLRATVPDALNRMIFSTGDIVSEEAAIFVRSAVCPVLQKPFELDVLRDAIDDVLKNAESSQ